jgi:Flp pilus assembly protein TadG
MVEMAIALPFLVVLSLGLVEFAIYMNDLGVVTSAVQEGAHAAAALQTGGAGRASAGEVRTRAILAAGLPSRVYTPQTPVQVTCQPAGCADTQQPQTVQVSVQLDVPIILHGMPSLTLDRSATVNVERFRSDLGVRPVP